MIGDEIITVTVKRRMVMVVITATIFGTEGIKENGENRYKKGQRSLILNISTEGRAVPISISNAHPRKQFPIN